MTACIPTRTCRANINASYLILLTIETLHQKRTITHSYELFWPELLEVVLRRDVPVLAHMTSITGRD